MTADGRADDLAAPPGPVRHRALPDLRPLDPVRSIKAKLALLVAATVTVAALLVCLVIVTLFVEEFFSRNWRWAAGGLFVAAMVALIGGLSCFLREVYVATHTIRFDPARLG